MKWQSGACINGVTSEPLGNAAIHILDQIFQLVLLRRYARGMVNTSADVRPSRLERSNDGGPTEKALRHD